MEFLHPGGFQSSGFHLVFVCFIKLLLTAVFPGSIVFQGGGLMIVTSMRLKKTLTTMNNAIQVPALKKK